MGVGEVGVRGVGKCALIRPPCGNNVTLICGNRGNTFAHTFGVIHPSGTTGGPRLYRGFLGRVRLRARLSRPGVVGVLSTFPCASSRNAAIAILRVR